MDGGFICHANFRFPNSSIAVRPAWRHCRALQEQHYTLRLRGLPFVCGSPWLIGAKESCWHPASSSISGSLHGGVLWLDYGKGCGKLLTPLVARLILCFGYYKIIKREFWKCDND